MTLAKHVILIVADSLRYDNVYKNNDLRLPYIESKAVQFSQARSCGCWTLPATASMFTGHLPHEHGATSQTRSVAKSLPTLAEKLKAAGYYTYQITANVATTEIFGLDRGFDEVYKIWQMVPKNFNKAQQFLALIGKPRLRKILLSKDAVTHGLTKDVEMATTWLQLTHRDIFNQARSLVEKHKAKGERCFVFLNLMETHFPYHVAPTFELYSKGWIDKCREAYSLFHFINQTFLKVDKWKIKPDMLDLIRQRQRESWKIIAPDIDVFAQEMHEDGDNLVVFCADHGDNFGEQSWMYHFSNVTDGGNKVPLFWLEQGGGQARTIDTPVNAKDLHYAILKACGIPSEKASFLDNPETSLSVMQSYWYNNRNKTLRKYKYNQFCFVEGNQRYLNRKDRWYVSPLTQHHKLEDTFSILPKNTNPIEEFVEDKSRQRMMRDLVKDFTNFSVKVL